MGFINWKSFIDKLSFTSRGAGRGIVLNNKTNTKSSHNTILSMHKSHRGIGASKSPSSTHSSFTRRGR